MIAPVIMRHYTLAACWVTFCVTFTATLTLLKEMFG